MNVPEGFAGGGESARYPIQAVERALAIIHILADSPGLRPLGVTEIAAKLGVSKSTAHRLLTTLAEFNFVSRCSPAGKYRLGWAFYQVAHRLPHATGVHAVAQPLIRQVAEDFGETVNLAVRSDNRVVIIETWGPPTGLKVETPRGIPFPMHTSAAGKALLVDEDEARLHQTMGRARLPATGTRTARALTSVRALAGDIAASHRRGYTLDDEEANEGVRCVGAPVRDHQGQIVAAVSITGPSQRLAGPRLEEAAARVRALALEISRAVGFAGETTL